jgi:hypothetical protein
MTGCPTCGGEYALRVGHIDSDDGFIIIVRWWECQFCGEKVAFDDPAYA